MHSPAEYGDALGAGLIAPGLEPINRRAAGVLPDRQRRSAGRGASWCPRAGPAGPPPDRHVLLLLAALSMLVVALAAATGTAGAVLASGRRRVERLVLAGLDHTATQGYQASFAGCTEAQREAVVSQFAQGRLVGGAWDELNVTRAWSVVMRAALAAFYSHPWAWNEIGFGGPAYPRGYMRLGGPGTDVAAVREPFEKPGATDEDPERVVQGWDS